MEYKRMSKTEYKYKKCKAEEQGYESRTLQDIARRIEDPNSTFSGIELLRVLTKCKNLIEKKRQDK